MKTFFSLLALSGLFALTSVPALARPTTQIRGSNVYAFLYEHPGRGGNRLVMGGAATDHYYDLSKDCWEKGTFSCNSRPTDKISFVSILSGCVFLWEHPNFNGRGIVLPSGDHDLISLGFDDVASSARYYSGDQCYPAFTFGYIKNSRLVASGSPPEPMLGHVNWAVNTGQSETTVKRVILEQLEQARALIAQSPSMQSCESFGHMKNGMLMLLRYTTEPHQGHVNWCRDRLNEGNWGQVVSAMDQEFVNPIRSKLGG